MYHVKIQSFFFNFPFGGLYGWDFLLMAVP